MIIFRIYRANLAQEKLKPNDISQFLLCTERQIIVSAGALSILKDRCLRAAGIVGPAFIYGE
jgi:hypothetical protein